MAREFARADRIALSSFGALQVLLLCAGSLMGQPKDAAEAFTFDPEPRTLQPALPFWWNVAVSPVGKGIVTAHGTERGGEWWVWNAETGKVVQRVAEPNTVRFVAFSPDGALVATANFDNAVRIYDAKTWTLLAYGHQPTGGHSARINALSFSGDGTKLATAGLDRTARVWNVAEAIQRRRVGGNQVVTIGPGAILEGHEQAVFAVALSPDGKQLVTGAQDGAVRLWSLPELKGATLRIGVEKSIPLSGHSTAVECVAFSRDGKRIASGSRDNTARLYDAEGKDLAILKGHNRGVMAMAFSPDSATLATVSGDQTTAIAGEIRLWDAADGKERGLVGQHTDAALGVAFTADGSRLVTTGRDRTVRVWDVAKRIEVQSMQPERAATEEPRVVQALAYSPDGSALAVAGEGGTISVWNVQARKLIGTLTGHIETVHSLAWTADNKYLVSGSADRKVIVWRIADRKAIRSVTHAGAVYAVAVSPDGNTIATGGFDKVVRQWKLETGDLKSTSEGHTASVRCLAFSPDGKHLASGGSDFSVRLWSLMDESVRELRGHTRTVRSLAYVSPNVLATGGDDGLVRVWNLADGEMQHTFGPLPDGVLSLAASPRGTIVAAGLGNGRILALDPRDGQTRAVLSGATDGVAAVAIAPNGRELAAGGYDRTVRIWSGTVKPALAARTYVHSKGVRAAAIGPDGGLMATGDDVGTIRVFDAATGEERLKWLGHTGPILDLAYSADGMALISGGEDRTAKVWRSSDGRPVKTCADHPGAVQRVALSKNGSIAATGSSDKIVRVFDLGGGTQKSLDAEAAPVAVQFLEDDSLLTAGGRRAYVWDIHAARVMNTLDGGEFSRVTAAAGAADGKLFVIAGDPTSGTYRPEDAGFCRVLTVSRYHPTAVSQRMHDTGVGAARAIVSPGGRIIAVAGGDGTVRVWDWPTLNPIRKFVAHAAAVPALAVSRRGEFIVSGSLDGSAKRWNASPGEPLVFAARILDESKQAWFARVAPDGKVLASGGDDRVLRLRDAIPGRYQTLPGKYPYAFSTAINKDGTILATGHLDGSIQLWDLKTNKLIRKLQGHNHRVWSIAFSPDGTRMVSGGGRWEQDDQQPGEIRVWDTATWKARHEIGTHGDLVFTVAVSPDNKTFASGSRDATIRTWDLATGKPIKTMNQGSPVRCVVYTLDGKRLYSCPTGGRLHWWDPERGTHLGEHAFDSLAFERLRLSPDGKLLAVAMRNSTTRRFFVALWDVEKNEIIRRFKGEMAGQINDVAFSPDGKTLATGGGQYVANPQFQPGVAGPWVRTRLVEQGGRAVNVTESVCEIRCWDVATGNPLIDLPGHKHWLEAIQFTPDGKSLITAGGTVGQPAEIRLWDTAGFRAKVVLGGHTNGITCGQFSPDGRLLATGSVDTTIIVWDVARALGGDSSAKTVLRGHAGLVRCVAWSADGTQLVSSAEDGTAIVWNPTTGKDVLKIAAHDRPVYGVAFSPDATMIVTAAGDWKNKKAGEARVWEAARGIELFRLPDTEYPAWGVSFTSDGQLVVAYQEQTALRVFDLKSRKEEKVLTSATPARGLAMSRNGKLLGITSQGNGLLKIWEVGTWREVHEVTGHPNKVVFTMEFAPDGQTVLSAGGDGAVAIWKIPGGDYKLPEFVPPVPKQPDVVPQLDHELPIAK
jgi:WD40 repeat protein